MQLESVGEKIFVKKLHMDNECTRLLFANAYAADTADEKEMPVDWKAQYPFRESGGDAEPATFWDKLSVKLSPPNRAEKASNQARNHLIGYYWLVEQGRKCERVAGWNIPNPAMNVVQFPDGNLTFVHRRTDMKERIAAVKQLDETAKRNHAEFVYVQAPSKVNRLGDDEIRGEIDFSNENALQLLNGLREGGVDVLDLQDIFSSDVPADQFHALFYRTDHHWKPETALQAARIMLRKFHDDYGVQVDDRYFLAEAYEWHVQPKWFLGAQGKKVTLARTQPDDFVWMEPKFPTKIHLSIPSLNKDDTGAFSVMLAKRKLETKNLYFMNTYTAFLYGDCAMARIDNLALEDAKKQKVLLLTDSFGDVLTPFIAMGVKHVIKVDLRNFTGSVESLIEKEQPDVVAVLYTATYDGTIHWKTHKDLFDFR